MAATMGMLLDSYRSSIILRTFWRANLKIYLTNDISSAERRFSCFDPRKKLNCVAKIINSRPTCIITRHATGRSSASPQKAKNLTSGPEYCAETVRKYDYENYLCTLLLPPEARAAAFAIRAFNSEIAQIRDMISVSTAGLMRMQFWKDALDSIFKGQPPHQPVALELARILQRQKLSKRWLLRIIESREDMLDDRAHSNVTGLEKYAENSVSSIYYLILEALNVRDLNCDHVASHLGKAQGISTLLRGVPFNASRGRVYLPSDVMLKHGVSQEAILQGSQEQNVKDVMYEIASLAHQHLEKARSMRNTVPRNVRNVFLPAVPCSSYLNRLQKSDFNVFDPKLQVRNNSLPFSLWWHKIRKVY